MPFVLDRSLILSWVIPDKFVESTGHLRGSLIEDRAPVGASGSPSPGKRNPGRNNGNKADPYGCVRWCPATGHLWQRRFILQSGQVNSQNSESFGTRVRFGLCRHPRSQLGLLVVGSFSSGCRTSPCRSGRQSARSMVPRDGIEPPTRGFSVRCSTD